jgi:H+/gluconate symporter-like permease
MPVLVGPLTQMGLSMVFIHRVGVFAATMIDSLPHSGAVNMAINIADLKMRDAYPAVFCSTVIATTIGTVVVALIMSLFPFLP